MKLRSWYLVSNSDDNASNKSTEIDYTRTTTDSAKTVAATNDPSPNKEISTTTKG